MFRQAKQALVQDASSACDFAAFMLGIDREAGNDIDWAARFGEDDLQNFDSDRSDITHPVVIEFGFLF